MNLAGERIGMRSLLLLLLALWSVTV